MSRRRLPKGKRRGNCLSVNRTLIRMLQVRIKRFVSTQVPPYIHYIIYRKHLLLVLLLCLYVNLIQRSLSCLRESVAYTNPTRWVSVLARLKCSYLVLSLKASAKVQQFSEPPKLFRSFFIKISKLFKTSHHLKLDTLFI